MSLRVSLLAILASVISIGHSAAAVLTIDGSGQLSGATGVDVNGSIYDVQFLDGTCADLFSGCDALTDFAFTTESDASAAAQALLDQVFLDGSGGNFDSVPSLTNGCETTFCFAYIPYELGLALNNGSMVPAFGAASALNQAIADSIGLTGLAFFPELTDLTTISNRTFAVFSPSGGVSEVPLPAAFPLFLLGLAGIGIAKGRSKSHAADR